MKTKKHRLGLTEAFVHTALEPKCIASNGYIGILELNEDNTELKTTSNNKWKKIRYTVEGKPYFIQYGIRYYLEEFFKTNGGKLTKKRGPKENHESR